MSWTKWTYDMEWKRITTCYRTYPTWLYCTFVSIYEIIFCILYVLVITFFILRLIDNLPAATKKVQKDTNNVIVYHGYRLGGIMNGQYYINNYLKLKLSYHKYGELV